MLFLTSDGQKIAKRLSNQINKETSKMKTIFNDYKLQSQSQVDILLVSDPSSSFWNINDIGTEMNSLPSNIKFQIIRNWLLMRRSDEEKSC